MANLNKIVGSCQNCKLLELNSCYKNIDNPQKLCNSGHIFNHQIGASRLPANKINLNWKDEGGNNSKFEEIYNKITPVVDNGYCLLLRPIDRKFASDLSTFGGILISKYLYEVSQLVEMDKAKNPFAGYLMFNYLLLAHRSFVSNKPLDTPTLNDTLSMSIDCQLIVLDAVGIGEYTNYEKRILADLLASRKGEGKCTILLGSYDIMEASKNLQQVITPFIDYHLVYGGA